jgi:hypothetical protein
MVGACKLAGRALGGVAMAPLISDIRENDLRGEFTSPCADAGRPSELVDRDKDGPIGDRTTNITFINVVSAQRSRLERGRTYTDTKRVARHPLTRAASRYGSASAIWWEPLC